MTTESSTNPAEDAPGHPHLAELRNRIATGGAPKYHGSNAEKGKLGKKVYPVPVELENYIAKHKLESMGIKIDELTTSQKHYMSDWKQGT